MQVQITGPQRVGYNHPMAEFNYYHPIEVRYGDLDPQGHVNNARYLTYFEQARINYIAHLGCGPAARSSTLASSWPMPT